jgi:hypothetical protein
MPSLRRLIVPVVLALAPLAWGQSAAGDPPENAIPDAETRDPPTAARLAEIERIAGESSWFALVPAVRSAAMRAYAQDRYAAADAWYHVYIWLGLFSEPESAFLPKWVRACRSAGLPIPPGIESYQPTRQPIGDNLTPEMKAWLLSNEAFSREFFSLITQVDHLPRVFAILDGLRRRGAEKFDRYQSLALALAVVYDVDPPAYWPHAQVTEASLPRKLPNPAQTYEWLIREESLGRNYHRLASLRADELKFVVDIAAQPPELEWVLRNVRYPLDSFDKVYDMVPYRRDRFLNESQMTWPGGPYTLPAILKQGGICVDQAYFATQAGKARGVPTLFFGGEGLDGRHAWFGFLDGENHWRLDAGRYAEQRFVTGIAYDPQTWTAISDHELQFLSERFRALPSYAQSMAHLDFAREFLAENQPRAAERAARKAVNYERRNVDAWEALIAAGATLGASASQQETIMREAALAFSPKYPDLMALYENRVCVSLRARGERSLADFEERGLAQRLQGGDRSDLAIRQASAILSRSIAGEPVASQIAAYNSILAQFGRGAGTMFFDQIVVGFAEHLAELHMKAQAREAVQRAAEALDVPAGSQLSVEVDALLRKFQD